MFVVNIYKKLTVNIALQYIGFLFTAATSFFISVFLARSLSSENFGYFITATSAGAVISVIIEGGCRVIIQREAIAFTTHEEVKFSKKIRFFFGRSIISSLILLAFGLLFLDEAPMLVAATILVFWSISIIQIRSAFLRGRGQFISDSIHMVVSRFMSAFFIIVLVFFGIHNVSYLLISWAVGLLLWLIICRFDRIICPPSTDFSTMKMTGLTILLIELLNALTFRFDLLYAQYSGTGQNEIALYGASLRLTEGVLFLAMPMRAFLFNAYRKNLNQKVSDVFELFVCVVFSLTIGSILSFVIINYSELIVSVIFGENFSGAVLYLERMSLLLPPMLSVVPLAEWFLAKEYERYYLKLSIVICILSLTIYTYLFNILMFSDILFFKILIEISVFLGLLSLSLWLIWNTSRKYCD